MPSTNPTDITRNVDGPAGNLVATTGKTGNVTNQITDLHGDVVLEMVGNPTALTEHRFDEFGTPDTATPPAGRYGWLGAKQRSAETLGGVILMGVRLYAPDLGRFLSVDPVDGGSASAYDYCNADPVNCTDLDGTWGWHKIFHAVARVAEYASWIPGPIGTAAAGVSAVAYLASGNRRKAAEMALTAAANLVGAGAAVRVGARVASRAWKAGRRLAPIARRLGRSCNSFDADTTVLLADGSQMPISQISAGDFVLAPDVSSGGLSAQPVLDVIVGQGDKHMFAIEISGRPELRSTADHPIWVEGRGWTAASQLQPGDQLRLGVGGLGVVRAMHDLGWLSGHTVYNLNVGSAHTYIANGVVVHNSTCSAIYKHVPRRAGVYVIHFKDGSKYVGRSTNMRRRMGEHFGKRGKFHGQCGEVLHISHHPARRGSSWVLRHQEQTYISHYTRRGYGLGAPIRHGGPYLRNLRHELGGW